MSGKGSKPRPLSVPQDQFDAAFDMIFQASKQCGLCNMAKNKCGCCPTDDGPAEDRPPYERRKTNREGV